MKCVLQTETPIGLPNTCIGLYQQRERQHIANASQLANGNITHTSTLSKEIAPFIRAFAKGPLQFRLIETYCFQHLVAA